MGSLKRPYNPGSESLLELDVSSINDLATLRQKLKEAQAALLRLSENASVRVCSEQTPRTSTTETSETQNSNELMFSFETMAAMLKRENELRTCEETQKAYAGEVTKTYISLGRCNLPEQNTCFPAPCFCSLISHSLLLQKLSSERIRTGWKSLMPFSAVYCVNLESLQLKKQKPSATSVQVLTATRSYNPSPSTTATNAAGRETFMKEIASPPEYLLSIFLPVKLTFPAWRWIQAARSSSLLGAGRDLRTADSFLFSIVSWTSLRIR